MLPAQLLGAGVRKSHEECAAEVQGRRQCFAQNLHVSPAPGVPLCQPRIDGLVTYYFKEPAPYPIDLTIAVPDVSY